MNEFKKQYELKNKPQVYSDMEEHIKQGKGEKERIIELTEEQKERNKIVDLINKAYDKEKLTEEERREFLSIDEATIPTTMLKRLYQLARAYIEGEIIDFDKLTEPGPKVDVTPERTSRKNRKAIKTN